jgi:hypothetical protein
MARKRARLARTKLSRPAALVPLDLAIDEAELLIRIADYYLQSMGPSRWLVQITAGPETRSRFRFVADESVLLKELGTSVRQELLDSGESHATVSLTARSAVAFWGRILASLRSPRSRRKLSSEEVMAREALSGKLGSALLSLARTRRDLLEEELATRRATEAAWMRSELFGRAEQEPSAGA